MNNQDNVVTTPKVEEIAQCLGLTLHGKIKLRAFEDDALDHAMAALILSSGAIKNKFDFFVSKAIEYSQKHRKGPHWKRYYNLRDAYNIPSEDRVFMEQSQQKQKFTPKRSTSEYERPIDPEREKYGRISNAMREREDAELEERQRRRQERGII